MGAAGVASKIKLNSLDSLFGTDTESVINVNLKDLHTFKDHPFKVLDDEKMQDLVDSIKERGVLVPATVRALPSGGYELISGHRRKHACKLAGLDTMPVIVRNLDDDDATVIMVDSNIQREELFPSERAFAFKMKLDAIKRQTGRPLKNGAQFEHNKKSVEIVADEVGESRANVQRFIRLTSLNIALLDLVDEKKMPLNVGVELSFLPEKGQKIIVATINDLGVIPSIAQAKRLREYSDKGKLTAAVADVILTEEKEALTSFKFKSDIKKYFPPDYSKQQMEDVIMILLEKYAEMGDDLVSLL